MAGGSGFSGYQKGAINRYYEHRDTMAIQNLGELVSELFLCQDPAKAARLWERVAKALAHTDAQPDVVQKVMAKRDVTQLSQLVTELSAPQRGQKGRSTPGTPPPPPSTPKAGVLSPPPAAGSSAPVDPSDPQVLKRAMKAFRKRLKLTRLDEESKLGVGPLTGGKRSGVVAIVPPNQFPLAVWDQLVQQGKLKQSGRGFYALAQE